MTYLGHLENGVLVLDNGASIPEGARVRVELLAVDTPEAEVTSNTPSLYDDLREVVGTIKDLPPDFAKNHDHYLHGQPKR